MRRSWSWLAIVAALGVASGCSKALRVSRDAAVDTSAPPGPEAGAGLAPEAGRQMDTALRADIVGDLGGSPDGGTADAPFPSDEAGGDADHVRWPGPDARITIGTAPPALDGGIYPQVYAFPGVALSSHSGMFPVEPDLAFRIEQIGSFQYADLNGDSLGDIVIAYGDSIGFRLQRADGSFDSIAGIALPEDDHLGRTAIADFNGDGRADLALVHKSAAHLQSIAIHLQGSDGFRSTPEQELAASPDASVTCDKTYFLLATDMNGDLRPDLVALTERDYGSYLEAGCAYDTANAQVFLQDAGGTFSLAIDFAPRSSDALCRTCATSLAAGDFTGDGQPDLAVIQYGQGTSSDADWVGREVLTYPRIAGGFAAEPAQVLRLPQYLKAVSFIDSNQDGKLDILARSADWGPYGPNIEAAYFTPGLTGVFLQKSDGSFDDAGTITPDDWLPAGTDQAVDPIGIDIRDIDMDFVLDLVLERRSAAEGLFRQERGLFASKPDVEVQSTIPDWVAGANQKSRIKYLADDGVTTVEHSGQFNILAYALADMNGDGRPDIVAAYRPLAPKMAPDPVTGVYPSNPSPDLHTYTLFRVYLQRQPARRFLVEIRQSRVVPDERVLRIEAALHNLSTVAADDVRVRVLAASSPVEISTTIPILAGGHDKMVEFGAAWVNDAENQVRGDPLGADIVVPHIEAGASIPLAIDVPVALVPDLDVRCIFLVVDPGRNTNLILKRKYDFIAPG
ncbi:MAG: VCBS repeat-containing protein [Deltaproteobacteria bacterium]|nr:VCBS repeat-containing protein [Deltaproteobacteria bacterium]